MQVCYKRGYSGKSASDRLVRYRMEMHEEDKLEFSRGLQEVVVGQDERVHARRSHRDVACPEFLAFVGSRVSLLQVHAYSALQDNLNSLSRST